MRDRLMKLKEIHSIVDIENKSESGLYYYNCSTYGKDLERISMSLKNRIYVLDEFLLLNDSMKTEKYIEKYNKFYLNEKENSLNISNKVFFKEEFVEIVKKLIEIKGNNESIIRNFIVKLLYWLDLYLPEIAEKEILIYLGEVKLHEYLLLFLLSFKGISVIILRINNLLKRNLEKFDDLCCLETSIDYNLQIIKNLLISERKKQKEVSFEEVAKLANSVVMINVYDRYKKNIASGSGVIISEKGYILTNLHVIEDGYYFGISLEEQEEEYRTYKIVKYNSSHDLALIKLDKVGLKKIDIYSGEKELVRGQKVVAIGSPLGLFNSVSDGIISGFRDIDGTEMIQFTAPISSGSSGGALLNLKGELIGVITAGFNRGQNINLAVNYKLINKFIENFK